MSSLTVYLAGPISNCNDQQRTRWRAEMRKFLKGQGHRAIDPSEGSNPEQEPDYIEESDVIVANLWRESIGTVFGIIRARSLGKPVILIDPNYVVRGSRYPVLKQIIDEDPANDLEQAKRQFEKLSERLAQKLEVETKKGRTEDFKPRKLISAISSACRASEVSDIAVLPVALSKRVEAALRSAGKTRVTTLEIKQEVFGQLQNLCSQADKTYPDSFKNKAAEVLNAWKKYEEKKDTDRALEEMATEEIHTIESLRSENQNLRIENERLKQLVACKQAVTCADTQDASSSVKSTHLNTARLEQKLGAKKILCVFDPHATDLRDSLRRAALPDEVLGKFFTFYECPTGRNSNLVQDIREKYGKSHDHVLCAFGGGANIRHGIAKSFSGPNFVREKARDAVDDFRKWLNAPTTLIGD